MPVCFRYSSALRATYRGSRVYISPVTGSFTKQLMLSVTCFVNGSRYAVSGSGTRSMSDSWISWNPRIEDPSNPSPSSKLASLISWTGTEKCCISPGRSENRRSTISAPDSLARARTSFAVAISTPSPFALGNRTRVEGVGGRPVVSAVNSWLRAGSVGEADLALDLHAHDVVPAVGVPDVTAGPAVDLVARQTVLRGQAAVRAHPAGDLVEAVEVRQMITAIASAIQVRADGCHAAEVGPAATLHHVLAASRDHEVAAGAADDDVGPRLPEQVVVASA